MYRKTLSIIVLMALVAISQLTAADKPLKIYILAGQSNMQGKAQVHTIPRMALDPKTKALHDKIVDEKGEPKVHKNVSIVYFTGGDRSKGQPRELLERKGLLSTGFGSAIGPELGFGITMNEATDTPILIIKTAWGGRSLSHHFRPPSAGVVPWKRGGSNKPVTEEQWKAREDEHYKTQGLYYRLILKLVNKVLEDPGKYSDLYDPKAGYEIAGFGWFQGYNDAGMTPYSRYTKNLTLFIKDIRKDLKAPNMPFAIGVIGIGGDKKVSEKTKQFRAAMAAVADVPEFKGNVVAIPTAPFWDYEVEDAFERIKKSEKIWETSKAWKPVGTPKFEDRIWTYTSFALAEEEQYKVYNKWSRKFLAKPPTELKDWLKPDFDTSTWQKGPAPIGKEGDGAKQRELRPDEAKLVRSKWGKGDILLMKTTFTIENDELSHFRLCVRNSSSYNAYINGKLVKDYEWYNSPNTIRKHDIDAKVMKVGVNELAVYSNIKEVKGFSFNAVDCYLEGMTKTESSELIKQQTELAPPKAYELIKGKSNQAYHYLGSAYTYCQIGEALAKSLINLNKTTEK